MQFLAKVIVTNMFITTHAAVGALVGAAFPSSRPLAFAAGFLSHFLLDMIPHGDEHMLEGFKSGSKVRRALAYVTIDSIVAVYTIMAILSAAPGTLHGAMKWGIIGGVLPDLLVGIYEATKWRILRGYTAFHHRNHHALIGKYRHGKDIPFKWGFAYQVVAAIILVKLAII